MNQLEEYREEIDRIDQELTRLVEQRLNVAKKVASYKQERGLPILDASREKAVIRRNQDRLENAEYAEEIAAFYGALMKISKEVQAKVADL